MSEQPNETGYIELAIPDQYLAPVFREPTWVYDTHHFEMIENHAALRFISDGEFPIKGIPIPESVQAVNIIKTLIREGSKFWFLFIFYNKNKLFDSFNRISNRALKSTVTRSAIVPHQFLCPTAFGVYSIVSNFLLNLGVKEDIAENTGYNIAHIFEHDDAWRYRLQDCASMINIEWLFDNPAKEIERVIHEFAKRQAFGGDNPLSARVKTFIFPLKLILMIPKFKHAFNSIIRFIKHMDYDDADWYWVRFRDDYNFGGRSAAERTAGMKIPKLYLMDGDKLVG